MLVLVAGGGVWRAVDQGVFSTERGPAYEPWKSWRDDPQDRPLALVRAAILAANPPLILTKRWMASRPPATRMAAPPAFGKPSGSAPWRRARDLPGRSGMSMSSVARGDV